MFKRKMFRSPYLTIGILLSHFVVHCTLPFKISYFFRIFCFQQNEMSPLFWSVSDFIRARAARAGARDIWKISKEEIDGLSPCVPPPSRSDKYLDGWEKSICERKRQKLLTEQKQNGGEKSFWNFSGPCGHAACREQKCLLKKIDPDKCCVYFAEKINVVWILLSRFCLSFVIRTQS